MNDRWFQASRHLQLVFVLIFSSSPLLWISDYQAQLLSSSLSMRLQFRLRPDSYPRLVCILPSTDLAAMLDIIEIVDVKVENICKNCTNWTQHLYCELFQCLGSNHNPDSLTLMSAHYKLFCLVLHYLELFRINLYKINSQHSIISLSLVTS